MNDCFYWQSIQEDNTYKHLAEGYFTILENLFNGGMKRILVEDLIVDFNPVVSFHWWQQELNSRTATRFQNSGVHLP